MPESGIYRRHYGPKYPSREAYWLGARIRDHAAAEGFEVTDA